ncbi:hypothetical protein [Desulfosediminicola sp.]|uniref:hypothetical protein n=1 Tax=Desulfosediminicola sp. TaxID=2886825 RepID=UPI003AF26D32
MTTFILLFIISLTVIICSGLIINFSKQRAGTRKHPLTAICHKTGDPASACSCSQLLPPEAVKRPAGQEKCS